MDHNTLFDQLDVNKDGFITRAEFENFRRRNFGGQSASTASQPPSAFGAPPMPPPPPAQVPMPSGTFAGPTPQFRSEPPPAQQTLFGKKGLRAFHGEEVSEPERLMKEVRRMFALAGPVLICILAFLPVWSAIALLRSRTYLYFSSWGTPIGGIVLALVIFIAFWMNVVMGVSFLSCPMPNPFRPFAGVARRVGLIPVEAWTMIFLTIFLMMVWKVINLGGLQAVFSWLGSVFHIVDAMWFSSNAAATILAICLAAVVLYMLSLNYFFARAKSEARRDYSSMFTIWAVFVFVMGAALMLLSVPISSEADKAYSEMLSTCETGFRTRDLYVTSQALQSLRQTPGCAERYTVEGCVGFQTTVYSQVLKSMEAEFKCAGFCYNPAGITPYDATSQPVATNYTSYPPTLFTTANFEASCDGMAARNMKHFVGAIGTEVFHQGAICVLAAFFLAAIQIVSLCTGPREKAVAFEPRSYGTIET
mmetsp:Transcript_16740/g.45754  ORF Transcript_16740/g.45754 Transcript_16740/m.45754 type:complete len:477 (-) Transcript_16740:52-1482(-)